MKKHARTGKNMQRTGENRAFSTTVKAHSNPGTIEVSYFQWLTVLGLGVRMCAQP
jgi:hypothetical protein